MQPWRGRGLFSVWDGDGNRISSGMEMKEVKRELYVREQHHQSNSLPYPLSSSPAREVNKLVLLDPHRKWLHWAARPTKIDANFNPRRPISDISLDEMWEQPWSVCWTPGPQLLFLLSGFNWTEWDTGIPMITWGLEFSRVSTLFTLFFKVKHVDLFYYYYYSLGRVHCSTFSPLKHLWKIQIHSELMKWTL